MKRKRIRLEPLSFFDHTGISAHLEKMAEKGWMIERIANYGWVYRKIEPKRIRFAVSYFPKASEFDPEPSEAQQTFLDFCAHSGWTLACTSAQMQIFYNERENPVPIETDPMLELETIHEACYKSFFLVQFIWLTLGLLMGFGFVGTAVTNPIITLSNPGGLFTGVCWLLLILVSSADLITYFYWRKKALQAAEYGIFLDTFSTAKLQKAALWILLIMNIYYLINILLTGDDLRKFVTFAMLAYLIVLYVSMDGVKRLLKRFKASASANRTVTLIVSVVLAFAMNGLINSTSIKLNQAGLLDHEQKTESVDEIPLRIEDLMEVPYDEYMTTRSEEESVFLARYQISQRPNFETEHAHEMPSLSYTIVDVKMPRLYDWCVGSLLRDDNSETVTASVYEPLELSEDVKAYRMYFEEDPKNNYLILLENRTVQLYPSWDLTGEQIEKIAEILG